MARRKTDFAAGIDVLLTPAATAAHGAQGETAAEDKQPRDYKTFCYSLPREVGEKIAYIAYWDRRKINAVVIEAFEKYAAEWKPAGGKPKKL